MNNIIKYFSFLFFLSFFINPILSLAEETETNTTLSVESAVCVSINKSLRYRASDRVLNSKDVTSLQNFLKEKGYLKVEPNGYFGEQTLQAVKDFQKDNELVSAGFVGPLTRGLISKYTCPEEIPDTNTISTDASVSPSSLTTEVDKKEKEEVKDDSKKEEVLNNPNSSGGENKKEIIAEASSTTEVAKKEEIKENKPTPIAEEVFLPKVMFWWGKVNQHINLTTGSWETDPDGISGANLDYLTYCKKWYPNTISIEPYKLETIDTWHERYNLNNHTSTKMSYLCVQPTAEDSSNNSYFFKIISPDGGEVYESGNSLVVKWKNNKASEDKKININLLYKNNSGESFVNLIKDTLNDGEESLILPTSGTSGILWGKNFKIYMHKDKENGIKDYEDYSKDFFTINEKTAVVDTNPGTGGGGTSSGNPTTPTNPDPVTPSPVTPDPVVPTTPTSDTTPRIAYWWGKVNQHTDANGIWQSDPDGTSGADLDKLTYCQKWYPATTSYEEYKTETITTFKRAKYYEQSDYTTTVPTYKCVGGQVLGASTEKNPNLCSLDSTLLKGMKSKEVKCLQQKLNQKGYKVVGTEGGKEHTQFGYYTMLALKKFQAENSLKADGILGVNTRVLLNK